MLSIRFLRVGKKHQPFFRIVATDKKNPPRGGRFLEILGFVNPFTKEKQLKRERIEYWLKVGAKPSDTVHNLLIREGLIKGAKKDVSPRIKEDKNKTTAGPTSPGPKTTSVIPDGGTAN